MDETSLLRTGLTMNAVLSLLIGLLLTLAASSIGDRLGVEIDGWLQAFGAVLIGHAAVLVVVRGASTIAPWGRANLAAIAPYPFLMVILAIAIIDTPGGRLLILADGLAVGAVAAVQFRGLRRIGGHAPAVVAS